MPDHGVAVPRDQPVALIPILDRIDPGDGVGFRAAGNTDAGQEETGTAGPERSEHVPLRLRRPLRWDAAAALSWRAAV